MPAVVFLSFFMFSFMLLQFITCKLISSFLLWLLVHAFILNNMVYVVNISATKDFK